MVGPGPFRLVFPALSLIGHFFPFAYSPQRLHQIKGDLAMNVLTRMVSTVLSFTLLIPSLAQPSSASSLAAPFELSPRLGYITESWVPAGQKPRVVLIQDLHLHYETQKRIIKILDTLFEKAVVTGPVAVEGVEGPYDMTKLASYPAGKLKTKLVDYFMKKGELSGDEAFSILRGDGKILYGVDSAAYYGLNKDLYKKTLASRQALEAKLKPIQEELSYLKKKHRLDTSVLGQNIKQSDEMVTLLQRLLHQEVTLEEARFIAQRLPAFVELTEKLLNPSPRQVVSRGPVSSDIEETIKSAVDFYIVALMRDKPLAQNTLKLLQRLSDEASKQVSASPHSPTRSLAYSPSLALVTGGFHTAGLTRAFKQSGIGYTVITPRLDKAPSAQSRALYEQRLAGSHLTEAELAQDFPRASDAVFARAQAIFQLWPEAWNSVRTSIINSTLCSAYYAGLALNKGDLLKNLDPDFHGTNSKKLIHERWLTNEGGNIGVWGKKFDQDFEAESEIWLQFWRLFRPVSEGRNHPKDDVMGIFHLYVYPIILKRISDHYMKFGKYPAVVVSNDPNLINARVPIVEVFDQGLVLVFNSAWVKELLKAARADDASQLAAGILLGEALAHALGHKFDPVESVNDWEEDEIRVLHDDILRHAYSMYKDGDGKTLSAYGDLISNFFEKHKIQSVASGWLRNPKTGLFQSLLAVLKRTNPDLRHAFSFVIPRNIQDAPRTMPLAPPDNSANRIVAVGIPWRLAVRLDIDEGLPIVYLTVPKRFTLGDLLKALRTKYWIEVGKTKFAAKIKGRRDPVTSPAFDLTDAQTIELFVHAAGAADGIPAPLTNGEPNVSLRAVVRAIDAGQFVQASGMLERTTPEELQALGAVKSDVANLMTGDYVAALSAEGKSPITGKFEVSRVNGGVFIGSTNLPMRPQGYTFWRLPSDVVHPLPLLPSAPVALDPDGGVVVRTGDRSHLLEGLGSWFLGGIVSALTATAGLLLSQVQGFAQAPAPVAPRAAQAIASAWGNVTLLLSVPVVLAFALLIMRWMLRSIQVRKDSRDSFFKKVLKKHFPFIAVFGAALFSPLVQGQALPNDLSEAHKILTHTSKALSWSGMDVLWPLAIVAIAAFFALPLITKVREEMVRRRALAAGAERLGRQLVDPDFIPSLKAVVSAQGWGYSLAMLMAISLAIPLATRTEFSVNCNVAATALFAAAA